MFRVARHTAHPTVVDCEDYDAMLSVADQWTRLKTGRDNPDFRRSANPFTFMTSCYDNRVITRLDFDTREEFAQQIEDIVKFHAMNDAWRGIDPPSDYVREHFIAAGAGRFMKPLPILQPLPLRAGHAGAADTPLVHAA